MSDLAEPSRRRAGDCHPDALGFQLLQKNIHTLLSLHRQSEPEALANDDDDDNDDDHDDDDNKCIQ